ncbi:hypothetical protein CTA2_10941 [Colletotrichum tanaceti]|uniref:RNase MRP protein 1 RNA binding domain-containing protein n=1 Tax=Colletotrichum tanaceti TaxID=1306861 RepID=A0A4U6XFI4_9PEZI|nr:hypothetical protein CTA2_10941 [Colletotrichum tanaceti]TKW54304.1 hypothetical protein CTA1_3205 [Colletotrichum tanaceti]
MAPVDTADLDRPTVAALVPVLQIFDGFNHRNKNQHRVARWWARFDLLRRSVRRLHDALEARVRHRHAQSFKAPSKKSASKAIAGAVIGNGNRRDNALDGHVTARARLLLDTIIPSSFIAFSQLAADNQHAALGLCLLGVLARINSTVAPLVSRQSERGGDMPITNPSASHDAVTVTEDQAASEPMGLGVAISRDQLKLAAKPPTRRPRKDEWDAVTSTATKKKRNMVDASDSESEPSSKPVKLKKPEKKPGKKKSKRGDEFSDLFSSLI